MGNTFKTLKRPKKPTRREKQELYKTPANYYQAKRKKAGQKLNEELNK
jgi:hypothetical protein